MPDQRGFAGSDMPQDVERLQDRPAGRRHLRARRRARRSSVSRWSATIGAARSPGGGAARRSAADAPGDRQRAASGRLPEEPDRGRRPARRLAIYHRLPHARASRRWSRRRASTGSSTRPSRGHVDLSKIPEAEKRQYIADWSQPGAFNAMLNWYRASRGHRAAAGRDRAAARLAAARLSERHGADARHLGHEGRALLPLQLDGLDELVDDLAIVRLPDAGHFAPWEAPRRGRRRARGPSLPGEAAASAARAMTQTRSRSRSAARLAAVQALYQQEMEGTPLARLLKEFHDHRLGATIEDATLSRGRARLLRRHRHRRRRPPRRDRRADRRPPRRGLDASSGSTGRCARSCAPAPTS